MASCPCSGGPASKAAACRRHAGQAQRPCPAALTRATTWPSASQDMPVQAQQSLPGRQVLKTWAPFSKLSLNASSRAAAAAAHLLPSGAGAGAGAAVFCDSLRAACTGSCQVAQASKASNRALVTRLEAIVGWLRSGVHASVLYTACAREAAPRVWLRGGGRCPAGVQLRYDGL